MPRYLVVRKFDVHEEEMPQVGPRSRVTIEETSRRSPGSTATLRSTTTGW
jgi:hypothetical protein